MTLDLTTVEGFEVEFDQVKALRDLLDTDLPLRVYCEGATLVLRDLNESDLSGSFSSSPLDSYSSPLLRYVESVIVMTRGISNLIDLVSPGIILGREVAHDGPVCIHPGL